jgi:plasmid stabilization system protein ParE
VNYWLHPDAEIELGDAAVYYAEHASKAVAMAFLTEFERVLALLIANQQLGAHAEDGLRTYPFRRFPYSLVYREDSAGPKIYAVAHQHREPEYWRDRS